eukprot:6191537-Pleurochrysis_carterae.AAC.3
MEATPAMYLATPPSEATAPPVGSTTPVRLLHFVRDVRRLAVSGFLYHSQVALMAHFADEAGEAGQTFYCANKRMR